MTNLFITGTDTDCGKTELTLALMSAFQARGERVLGMKPVASGCEPTPQGLRNADALRLQAQASVAVDYRLINPFTFRPPIAPHIAAAQAGVEVAVEPIRSAYDALCARADRVLVEGVGGWRVPLGPGLDLNQLPRQLELSVILVVGMRLGCLNHALLTAESIEHGGDHLIGWISNQVDPHMAVLDDNLATLAERIAAPCLGVIPWQTELEVGELAARLDLPAVF